MAKEQQHRLNRLSVNPFFNFLKALRIKHKRWPDLKVAVEAARRWQSLDNVERKKYSADMGPMTKIRSASLISMKNRKRKTHETQGDEDDSPAKRKRLQPDDEVGNFDGVCGDENRGCAFLEYDKSDVECVKPKAAGKKTRRTAVGKRRRLGASRVKRRSRTGSKSAMCKSSRRGNSVKRRKRSGRRKSCGNGRTARRRTRSKRRGSKKSAKECRSRSRSRGRRSRSRSHRSRSRSHRSRSASHKSQKRSRSSRRSTSRSSKKSNCGAVGRSPSRCKSGNAKGKESENSGRKRKRSGSKNEGGCGSIGKKPSKCK